VKAKYKPGMLVEFKSDEDMPVETAIIRGVVHTVDAVVYALEGETNWMPESAITAAYKRVSTKASKATKLNGKKAPRKLVDNSPK
jgi:hypothetical protein